MNEILSLIVSILQITLLNIVLSGDNVSVIALAIRSLPERQAKMASIIGASGAVVLRIIFTCMISLILKIDWLPIKLIGGLLLAKITWDLINMDEDEVNAEESSNKTLWKAAISIIIADVSMSLDNVLAIAGAANGNLLLIIFGIVMSIPIIFFGSQFIAKLMNKYEIIVYIGASLLAYTSLTMITEDAFVAKYIYHIFSIILSVICGLLVLMFGVFSIRKQKEETANEVE